jgi:hypothetical protein
MQAVAVGAMTSGIRRYRGQVETSLKQMNGVMWKRERTDKAPDEKAEGNVGREADEVSSLRRCGSCRGAVPNHMVLTMCYGAGPERRGLRSAGAARIQVRAHAVHDSRCASMTTIAARL